MSWGRIRPVSTKVSLVQVWPEVEQRRPGFARHGPRLARNRPQLARCRSNLARIRPKLAGNRRESGNVGPDRSNFAWNRPRSPRVRLNLDRHRSTLARSWPTPTDATAQTPRNLARHRAEFGRNLGPHGEAEKSAPSLAAPSPDSAGARRDLCWRAWRSGSACLPLGAAQDGRFAEARRYRLESRALEQNGAVMRGMLPRGNRSHRALRADLGAVVRIPSCATLVFGMGGPKTLRSGASSHLQTSKRSFAGASLRQQLQTQMASGGRLIDKTSPNLDETLTSVI